MPNTLGNLYSSFKTRLSNFLGDDEEDKIKLQTKPVQTVSFSTRGQNRSYTPVKLKTTSTQNPYSGPKSNIFGDFKSGYKTFQTNQSKQNQSLANNKINFTKNLLSRKTIDQTPARVQPKTAPPQARRELIPGGIKGGLDRVRASFKNPQQYNLYSQIASGNVKSGIKPVDFATQAGSSYIQSVLDSANKAGNILGERQKRINEATQGMTLKERLMRNQGQGETSDALRGLWESAKTVAKIQGPLKDTGLVAGGGAINAIFGNREQNLAQRLGGGAAEGAGLSPVLSVTNPATEWLVNKVGGGFLLSQLGKRGVSGSANVLEDRIIASLDDAPDSVDDTLSFLMGFGLSGNDELLKKIKFEAKLRGVTDSLADASKEVKQQIVQSIKDTPELLKGKLTPFVDSLKSQLDEAMANSGSQGGFISLGKEQESQAFLSPATQKIKNLDQVVRSLPDNFEEIVQIIKGKVNSDNPDISMRGMEELDREVRDIAGDKVADFINKRTVSGMDRVNSTMEVLDDLRTLKDESIRPRVSVENLDGTPVAPKAKSRLPEDFFDTQRGGIPGIIDSFKSNYNEAMANSGSQAGFIDLGADISFKDKLSKKTEAISKILDESQTPAEAKFNLENIVDDIRSRGTQDDFQALKRSLKEYKKQLTTGPGLPRNPEYDNLFKTIEDLETTNIKDFKLVPQEEPKLETGMQQQAAPELTQNLSSNEIIPEKMTPEAANELLKTDPEEYAKAVSEGKVEVDEPTKLVQDEMSKFVQEQSDTEIKEMVSNIKSFEQNIHSKKLPVDSSGKIIPDDETMVQLFSIENTLDDNPSLVTNLDGKTIELLEETGTKIKGTDGQYKDAGQALQEFRFQEEAKKAELTDLSGQTTEQALTPDVGQQVVDKGVVETGQTSKVGDQEVPVGATNTSTDALAKLSGQTQDVAKATSLPEGKTGQAATPLTQEDYQQAMENIAALLPSGEQLALPGGSVKVKTREEALKALKELSPGTKVEVFNQLEKSLDPINASPPGTPFTVSTGEEARQILAKYPDANIRVMNELPAGTEPINPLSENQVKVMLSENPVGKIEEMIYGSATPEQIDLQRGDKSGAGFVSNKIRALQENASKIVGEWGASQNPVLRGLSQGMRGFAGGLGKTADDVARKGQYAGGVDYASQLAGDAQKHVYDLVGSDPKVLEKLHAVLDPELAKTKVSFDDLTPKEQEAVGALRTMSDFINDTNYKNGFLSEEQWLQNRGGKYIARAYEDYDYPEEVSSMIGQGRGKLDLNPFKKRESLTDWKEEKAIRDPAYLMAKRLQQTLFNDSVVKMSNDLLNTPYVSDVERPGFVKVSDHKAYGDLAGKYVRKDIMEDIKGFFFTHDAAQKAYDLLNWYDRNPVRGASKKLLTIFNPAVQLGNKTGNYVFAWMNGINPVTFTKNKIWATKALDSDDGLVRRMMKDGLLGTDMTRADIVRMANELKQGVQDKNILQKIDDSVTTHYGKVDDIAKVSAMKTWLDRGLSYEESARRVYSGFQNYRTVGWLYDVAAKSPVLGNPFVRFKADLGRILKNAAIDHPFRLGMTLAGWGLFTKAASMLSGETQQDKETREGRLGASRIPFTDISLEFQTPWGAVNAGRLIGPQAFNQLNSSSKLGDLSDFGPFLIPQVSKQTGMPYNFTGDPILQPLASLLTDTDFRGKSISDPEQNKYTGSLATAGEKAMNRLKYLGEAYSPPGLDDINRVKNSFLGKKDYYGRTFTPGQSIARLFGLKVEQFGPEEAQARREKDLSYQLSSVESLNKKISSVYSQLAKGEITAQQADKRVGAFQKQIEDLTGKINGSSGGVGQTGGGVSGIGSITKQDKKRISSFLDAGIDVSDQDLVNYYAGDLAGMDKSTPKGMAKFQESAFKIVDDVLESDLPENKKALVLENLGIPEEDARYYLDATESQAVRFAHVTEAIQGIENSSDLFDALIPLKKEVNGKAILTSSVLTDLYEAGYISSTMKKLLGNYKWNSSSGKVELSRSAKESSIKKPKKISLDMPSVSTPKLSLNVPSIDLKDNAYTPSTVSLKLPDSLRPKTISDYAAKTPTAGANISPRLSRPVSRLSSLGTV